MSSDLGSTPAAGPVTIGSGVVGVAELAAASGALEAARHPAHGLAPQFMQVGARFGPVARPTLGVRPQSVGATPRPFGSLRKGKGAAPNALGSIISGATLRTSLISAAQLNE